MRPISIAIPVVSRNTRHLRDALTRLTGSVDVRPLRPGDAQVRALDRIDAVADADVDFLKHAEQKERGDDRQQRKTVRVGPVPSARPTPDASTKRQSFRRFSPTLTVRGITKEWYLRSGPTPPVPTDGEP